MRNLKSSLVALVLCATPILALAADFPNLPLSKKIDLKFTASVGGQEQKGALSVAAGTVVKVAWTSVAAGCLSNFKDAVLPSVGSFEGTIPATPASRAIILTCYDVGNAQTSRIQVNVVKPDIAVSTVSLSGAEAVTGKRGVYRAGSHLSLKAEVRNLGKLPITAPFTVAYQWSRDGKTETGWLTLAEKQISALSVGSTASVPEYIWTAGVNDPTTYYFRVIADSGNSMGESNERNNSKAVSGSYKFE